MTKCSKEPVVTIGIDLAKNSVHVYGVDAQGHQVLSKKVSRGTLSVMGWSAPLLQRAQSGHNERCTLKHRQPR